MMSRFILSIFLLPSASSITAEVDQDTMPFLVMPDGQKVMASHVLKFPLKREASGLAYDSLTNQFIICFDKGIPQLATFKLKDSITDLRQLSIAGDTTYYDLEGVEVQRSDSQGIRLKLCGERVIHDSLPILTLRCNTDSCWHDSTLVLTRPFEPGVNTNWEGITIASGVIYLCKEREPAGVYLENGEKLSFGVVTRFGFTGHATGKPIVKDVADLHRAYSGTQSARIQGRERLAYSSISYEGKLKLLLVLNRPARELLIISGDLEASPKKLDSIYDILVARDSLRTTRDTELARYELVDHPLEWTGTDTGDLLYGLVEGIAIGQVNGIRSLVMITDPGFGNHPKVVVFPWVYTNPATSNQVK